MNSIKIIDTKSPAILHCIWLGSPIPQKNLKNLLELALLAKKSGFILNLWVDDNKNFSRALENLHSLNGDHLDLFVSHQSFGVTLKNINTLLLRMENDPFYQQDNRLRDFIIFVNQEAIGFKNFAAGSDPLRYEIERQDGGIYIDMDTFFNIKGDSFLKKEELPIGIKFSRIDGEETLNDVIAAVPNHPVMEYAIVYYIKKYRIFSKNNNYHFCGDKYPANIKNQMDAKRYPYPYSNFSLRSPRMQLTIDASGPWAIRYGFSKFTAYLCESLNNSPLFQSGPARKIGIGFIKDPWNHHLYKIGNVDYKSESDKSWMPKESEDLLPFAFDTNDIPKSFFFSKMKLDGQADRVSQVDCALDAAIADPIQLQYEKIIEDLHCFFDSALFKESSTYETIVNSIEADNKFNFFEFNKSLPSLTLDETWIREAKKNL